MKTVKQLTRAGLWIAAFLITINILSGSTLNAQTTVPEHINVNINTNTDGTFWYAQPWVWVVGVALFIIIVIAIARGGSREY